MLRTALSIASIVLAAGCSYRHQVAPLDAGARAELGALAIETRAAGMPGESESPVAYGGGVAALEAVGEVAAGTLGSCGGCDGLGAAAGVVLFIVAAPIAATVAAVTAPSQDELDSATRTIVSVHNDAAWGNLLHERVAAALRAGGRPAREDGDPADSNLDLSVAGPFLMVHRYDGLPAMTVRGKLQRRDTCILDRHWRWNGTAVAYVELGEDSARRYTEQMRNGVGGLARAIVEDLFFSDVPRPVAYASERAFKQRREIPLAVWQPLGHQDQIVSWDNPEFTVVAGRPCAIADTELTRGAAPAGPPW